MATSYTVTPPAPVEVTMAGWPNGALLKNTGTAAAYAADQPGLQVAGFPIDAGGGTLSWDGGRPLYLTADATTTVLVDENSGSVAASPTDIAAALIAGGLPADIAAQIALTGAPTIDNPKVVALQTTSVPVAQFGGFYDVTGYNSLTAYINITAPAGAGDDIPEVSLTFTNKGYFQGSSPMVVQGHKSTQMMITLPVTGSGVTLSISAPSGYTALGYLTASYRPVQARSFVVKNAAWSGTSGVSDRMWDARATSYFLPVAAGVTGTFYPSYASSPTQWTRFIAGSTPAGVDHYLLSEIAGSSSWAPLAGDYGVTVADQIKLDTGLYFGSAQPLLHINNHNTTSINATGFLGSLE